MSDEWVSAREFLQKADIPYESCPDVGRVEKFIAENKIDKHLLEIIPQRILRRYAKLVLADEPISYMHLMREEILVDRRTIDYSDMRHMMVMRIHDASISCLVIDFEIGKAYVSLHGDISNDVCLAEKVIELRDEALSDVGAILNAAKVKEAEYFYQGDTSYRQGTVLAMALPDGIARFVSVGIKSGFPIIIHDACNYLIKCFYNM